MSLNSEKINSPFQCLARELKGSKVNKVFSIRIKASYSQKFKLLLSANITRVLSSLNSHNNSSSSAKKWKLLQFIVAYVRELSNKKSWTLTEQSEIFRYSFVFFFSCMCVTQFFLLLTVKRAQLNYSHNHDCRSDTLEISFILLLHFCGILLLISALSGKSRWEKKTFSSQRKAKKVALFNPFASCWSRIANIKKSRFASHPHHSSTPLDDEDDDERKKKL